MTTNTERDLDALVAAGVLHIERRNHRFRFKARVNGSSKP